VSEMHIKSATGEKTVKNMETCAYNTGYGHVLGWHWG